MLADIKANEGGPPMEWRTLFILLVTPVLLTIFYYYGRPIAFRQYFVEWAGGRWGFDHPFFDLFPYVYWAGACMVIRVLVPLLLIVAVMRHRPSEYGFRVRGSGRHVPIYLGLFLVMLPFLYWASLQDSFQSKYPFYQHAAQGGWHFWGFEILYLIQFFALEAFFRGFMLFGLAKRFGYYSVAIMSVPYCMIHFNKPLSETLGAIVAGCILGVLALRSKSFYWGVVLHFGVALTMDLLALWQVSKL